MHNKRFIIAIAVAVLVGLLGVCFLFFVVFFTLSVPELPAQTPPSYLLEAFKDIHDSKILFNPPLEMDQGKAARIEARISYSDIGDAITKGLKGPGKPQVEAIQVGQEMTVKLYADKKDFEIKKYSSDEQWVEGRPFAQWE